LSSTTSTQEEKSEEQLLLEENESITNKLVLERSIRVAETAKKVFEQDGGRFIIKLKIPTGKKIPNPFGGEDDEYKEDGEYDEEPYYFHKVSANDWNTYMTKRAELSNETAKPLPEQDQNKIADLNARIYEFLALKYLGMKHDDYIRAEWDDIRLAVDACNHVTEWASKEIGERGAGTVQALRPPRVVETPLRDTLMRGRIDTSPNKDYSKEYDNL